MTFFDTTNPDIGLPQRLVRGDYAVFRDNGVAETYPPATHGLAYHLRREGDPARKIEITGAESNGYFLFEITSAVSGAYEAGVYFWDCKLTQTASGNVVTVETGRIRIVADRDEDSDDPREFPRKMLAEIRRALLARATNNQLDTLAYALGLESSATRNVEILRRLEQQYRRDLVEANRKWKARRGIAHSGVIKFRL